MSFRGLGFLGLEFRVELVQILCVVPVLRAIVDRFEHGDLGPGREVRVIGNELQFIIPPWSITSITIHRQ